LIRGGFQQNDWRELIERILLHQAAKFETADVRQTIVQKNQIRLRLQAASDCGFAIWRRNYIAPLVLQERFQFFAVRRCNIYKQDGWVHASLAICPRRDKHTTPRARQQVLEGLDLLVISNPCARRMLPPLPEDKKG
jgi:hypothetical protein